MSYELGDLSKGGRSVLSRRALLVLLVAGAGAGALTHAFPLAPAASSQRGVVLRRGGRPLVSFHNDVPYVDRTGWATPYVPPCYTGCNSEGGFALYSEGTLRSRHSFI
jgi:hypothetical protein